MTATIHTLHPATPRPAPDNTIRVDCEELMYHLARDGRTPRNEMEILADVLEHIISRLEQRT
jgi:hypothetical protein